MRTLKMTSLTGVVAIAFAATSSANTIIYQHSFGGFGSPLNGVATDVGGQNWIAGPAFLDDGTVATVVASSANGNAAWLPFTPVDSKIYTLEATIRNTFADWIGVGFLPLAPSGTPNWSDTNFSVRHSNAPGWAWVLNRTSTGNDQEGFNGNGSSGTANGAFGGDFVNPSNVNVKITLNTMNPQWTAQYFLNGTQQGGTFNIDATAHDGVGTNDIRGVGFSRDRNASAGTGGSVSGFSLMSIPEPGTGMLMLFSLVAVGAIRRRANG